jgi:hypothetical protein
LVSCSYSIFSVFSVIFVLFKILLLECVKTMLKIKNIVAWVQEFITKVMFSLRARSH